jgi:hypothetical protein
MQTSTRFIMSRATSRKVSWPTLENVFPMFDSSFFMLRELASYTCPMRWLHKKKCGAERYGYPGAHSPSDINRYMRNPHRNDMLIGAVWQVPPSCWNHESVSSISSKATICIWKFCWDSFLDDVEGGCKKLRPTTSGASVGLRLCLRLHILPVSQNFIWHCLIQKIFSQYKRFANKIILNEDTLLKSETHLDQNNTQLNKRLQSAHLVVKVNQFRRRWCFMLLDTCIKPIKPVSIAAHTAYESCSQKEGSA